MHLPTREELAFGASYSLATLGEHRWETLVTACFLHDGGPAPRLQHAGALAGGTERREERRLGAGGADVPGGGRGRQPGQRRRTTWFERTAQVHRRRLGRDLGVLAAALVLGWRVQGLEGSLHPGDGALARLPHRLRYPVARRAAATSTTPRTSAARSRAAPSRRCGAASTTLLGAARAGSSSGVCAGLLAVCIGIVGWHDRTDRFATHDSQERDEFTTDALMDGRCRDAHDGLLAVERLRSVLAPVTKLRDKVVAECGHVGDESSERRLGHRACRTAGAAGQGVPPKAPLLLSRRA